MGLRSGDWLGHSRYLEMLLTKPLLRCPGRCVWDHCHAERPSHVSSSMPLLMEGGFHSKSHDTWPHSFFPLHRSVVLVPLQKNSPKAWCFHPMLHSRYGVLSPPNTTSWVFTKKFCFGFIWPYNILPILFWIIQMLSSKLQTGLDMYWLKQGDTSGTAGFESLAAQCVTDGSPLLLWSQLSAGHSLGPPVWFWDFCSQFLWSFWPHGVRSCVEPQIEGDYQWSCMSSIF